MPIAPHDLEEFSGELPPPRRLLVADGTRLTRRRRILKVVTGFLFGQGMLQGTNILASLFLVRVLSVEAFAQFSLATGFQSVFSILMDLGFASTIVPLVGDRSDDLALVGRYVRSARRLRDLTFWVLAPVAAAIFLSIMHKHHWSLRLQILLLGSVLLTLYSSGPVSYFSAPLFIFGRLREYYVPQILTGLGRLLVYFGLALTTGLNAWTAAAFAALTITANGILIRKASRKFIEWPAKEHPATDRELVRYILPAIPAIVFAAIQLQVPLFLVSIFGRSQYIAEVAALGKIGQLFAVLMTFNTIVIEPYIARLDRKRLLRNFVGLVLLASAVTAPLVLIAFLWPEAYIWVIGTKYEGVRDVMGWYLLSVSLNFVAGLMWIMNRARRWVFWSGSILEIALLLIIQISFIMLLGVRTTREAVFFNLASSFCYLAAHGYVSIIGFIKGARVITETGSQQLTLHQAD